MSHFFRAQEPTIESLSTMGLDISAVGNHEFDRGPDELLRMRNGGCRPSGCVGPQPFRGAAFPTLSTWHANGLSERCSQRGMTAMSRNSYALCKCSPTP
jgi:2',3'-cyclic-nucleotide 2'-phosphodiesterase (5'-nucleotidase family)